MLVKSLSEAIKGEDNHCFNVQVYPVLATLDINWDCIVGLPGKEQLIIGLETLEDLMISVATGSERAQTEDSLYKIPHNSLYSRCKKLNI